MKASNSSTNVRSWSSPVPYLFGGLGVMSVLIAAALIILACSFRKRPGARDAAEGIKLRQAILPLDPEPRVVVIVAGDDLPRFLAEPAVWPSKPTAPPSFADSCDEKV